MILCLSSAVVAVVVDVVVDVAAAGVVAAVAAYGHLAGCTKNKIKQKQPRATTSICCELKNFLFICDGYSRRRNSSSSSKRCLVLGAARSRLNGQLRITASCFGACFTYFGTI